MAVDKKSDYYNPPADYQDRDGHWKNFTYIDHDKKPSMKIPPSKEEVEDAIKYVRTFKEERIASLLCLPAVNALMNKDGRNEEFVDRNLEEKSVKWREDVVREACMINSTLLENIFIEVWRRTVKEQYWYEDMSHKDILAGKWKEWI